MPQAEILSDFDLARRALPGTYAYFVALAVSLAMSPLTQDYPRTALLIAAGISLTSVFRITIIVRQARYYREHRAAWNRLFNATSILISTLWGSFAAIHFVYYELRVTTVLVLLTVCGFAAGSTTSLHARLWLARSYLVLLLVPSLSVNLWRATQSAQDANWTAGCLVMFFAYLWFQSRQFNLDYWESAHHRENARRERDKLKASEERFRYVLEASRVGVWERDLKTGTMYYSDTLRRICGIDSRQSRASRQALLDTLHPEDRRRVDRELLALNYQCSDWTGDCRVVCAGETRWVSIHAHREEDSNGQPMRIVGTVLDISERKQTEHLLEEQRAQLISSSKMAALGEMAAGIAHEINNPLAIINLNTGIIQSCLAEETIDRTVIADRTGKIFMTIRRIAGIIKGLRAFSRNAGQDPCAFVSVKSLVDETLSLLAERIRNHQIELRISPPPEGLAIECRSVEISQILVNLLNNAFDAVAEESEKWIALSVTETKDHVEISVSDSGPGVPAELRDKIMQPFFTTKSPGKGTGLGLSISKGVADAHEGRLFLSPELKPTKFVLVLPKVQRVQNSA